MLLEEQRYAELTQTQLQETAYMLIKPSTKENNETMKITFACGVVSLTCSKYTSQKTAQLQHLNSCTYGFYVIGPRAIVLVNRENDGDNCFVLQLASVALIAY